MTADATFKTADLADEHPEAVSFCEPLFRSFGARRRFSGPISTVRVPGDNVLVREALEKVPEGSVLVVDGGGSLRCALLGGNLSEIAAGRNLPGVIVNGCVRDTQELAQADLGILALAAHPRKSNKEGKGERDVTLRFGGVEWTSGHYVYADEDGVILSKAKLA